MSPGIGLCVTLGMPGRKERSQPPRMPLRLKGKPILPSSVLAIQHQVTFPDVFAESLSPRFARSRCPEEQARGYTESRWSGHSLTRFVHRFQTTLIFSEPFFG
jgi:hypothetical protein